MRSIEQAIYDLLQTEPFFANFILGSQIVTNDPKIERAGATISKTQVIFYVNPTWYDALPRENRTAVFKHEVFHVLLDHVLPKRYGKKENRMAKNFAMDCAINQYIQNLPENVVTLKTIEEVCKKQLKPFECWEYYYEQIKESVKDSDEWNDHDKMESGEESEGESEAGSALRRAIIRDIANKAIKASAGNVPDGVQSIISELNKQNKINWKQQLRNLISSARVTQTKPSRMKVHRRFELDQPGKKKDRKLVLGVCTDSSGSVSNEAYASFMTEIHHIAKSTSLTYLVHADCAVQKVDIIKGGKAKPGVLSKRHGGGGTAYQPAIDECVKRGCDAIVYFGDMDSADKPSDPRVPFIWVVVGQQDPPGNFGKVLRLD